MSQVTKHLAARDGTLSLRGARLVVVRGPDKGRALKLGGDEITIGTAESSTFALRDPTVSRQHLALRLGPDAVRVRDLESTNGTFVGGFRVRDAFLQPGDTFEVGSTRIKIEASRETVDVKLSEADSFGRLIGRSVAAKQLFAALETLAKEDVTVALSGETGVGKDLCAEALHEASRRAAAPFVVVDCSAIPGNLLEAELFGHEKGAFTGATQARAGAFVDAHGGTLFLDEIGELPRELQPKLLRALERREVRPLGTSRTVPVDLRIISATNRDLRLDVNRGLFREDLYYRLHVVPVRVPPLRERKDDIPLLAEHFRRQITRRDEGALPAELIDDFLAHDWPGNVRELRNRVEYAVVMPDSARAQPRPQLSYHEAKQQAVDAFEVGYLTALLARCSGNVSEAARQAEIDRVHLTKLLRKYNVKR
jgi:two-component system, NtrC family, response regulator GlrR